MQLATISTTTILLLLIPCNNILYRLSTAHNYIRFNGTAGELRGREAKRGGNRMRSGQGEGSTEEGQEGERSAD